MKDKISLAGDLGSGKSTVSSILTEMLGMEYYSTGTICRGLAEKFGIDVAEMNKYMETHPEVDKMIDDGLRALSEDPRALLIDSRMAWHFVRDTFRVYLSTETAVSAARIFGANRSEEHFATVEETEAKIRERRESEKKRYMAFYGVNNKDLFNYDLILDTTYTAPAVVAEEMARAFRLWQEDHSRRFCAMSPLRLYYHDDEPSPEKIAALSAAIEAGERPVVDVFTDGERFCVKGAPETALAYALSDIPYVPCRMVREPEDGNFIRMSDTL